MRITLWPLSHSSLGLLWLLGVSLALNGLGVDRCAIAQEVDPAVVAAIQNDSKRMVDAFNSGKASDVAAIFLSSGELIDDSGRVHQGKAAIQELVSAFLTKFPEAKMTQEVDSVRVVGPVAIQEGRRTTTAKDGSVSQVRYRAVLSKTDAGWRIASLQDMNDEPLPSAHEKLTPLGWLVGEWVNEGADARVKLAYRWSEDQNFLLGEIEVTSTEGVKATSSHRIGWDPIQGKVRSWLFDSDGGFGEGFWSQLDDRWVIQSSAVLPDGISGAATLSIIPESAERFLMRGSNRIVGNTMEDDYEIAVVKRPPAPGK